MDVTVEAQATEIYVTTDVQSQSDLFPSNSFSPNQMNSYFTFFGSTPGSHSLNVNASHSTFGTYCSYTDDRSYSFEVINVDPEVSITAPNGETYLDGETVSISVSVYDPGDIASVNAIYNGISIPLSYSGGYYTGSFTADINAQNQEISVIAQDYYNGEGTANTSITVKSSIESSIEITSTSPIDGTTFYVGDYISTSFDVNDPLIVKNQSITFMGQDFFSNTASFTATGSGMQTLVFWVDDVNGNSDRIETTIFIENLTPTPVILSPSNGQEFSEGDGILFDYFLSDEDDATILLEVTFNGNTYNLLNGSPGLTAPTPGNYSITLFVEDEAGQTNSTSVDITVIDQSLITPTVEIIGITEGQHFNVQDLVDFSLEINGDIDPSSILLSYEGNTIDPTGDLNFITIGSGEQQVVVSYTDIDGNPYQTTVTFSVINQAPSLSILLPVQNEQIISGSEINIDYILDAIDDDVVQLNASIDGKIFNLLRDETLYAPSELGSAEIIFLAVDEAGLSTEVTISIEVIEQAPLITDVLVTGITNNENIPSGTSKNITFEVIGETNETSVSLLYNGQIIEYTSLGNGIFTVSLTVEGEGSQKIEFSIEDPNGLPFTKEVEFVATNTPPILEINEPTDFTEIKLKESFLVDLSFSDPENNLASAVLEFEGNSYNLLNDIPQNLTPSTTGIKTFSIVLIDELGAKTEKSITIIVNEKEVLLPQVTIISPLSNSLTSNKDDLFIDIEVYDPENLGIKSVKILFINPNNDESMVYQKDLDSTPFELSFDDLEFFPWDTGTVGMQVLVTTNDGRISTAYTEFDIDIENEFAVKGQAELNSLGLQIYPIPTNGTLNIKVNESIIFNLKTLKGELLLSGQIDEMDVINLEAYPIGLYLLEIIKDEYSFVRRISLN